MLMRRSICLIIPAVSLRESHFGGLSDCVVAIFGQVHSSESKIPTTARLVWVVEPRTPSTPTENDITFGGVPTVSLQTSVAPLVVVVTESLNQFRPPGLHTVPQLIDGIHGPRIVLHNHDSLRSGLLGTLTNQTLTLLVHGTEVPVDVLETSTLLASGIRAHVVQLPVAARVTSNSIRVHLVIRIQTDDLKADLIDTVLPVVVGHVEQVAVAGTIGVSIELLAHLLPTRTSRIVPPHIMVAHDGEEGDTVED